ncbi:hypothetical protein [Candidatus Odyssella thessalonicensis]|uniref:hypothetical protein n=1 Tax=Candidatus Odyssella thessalonicensis TaxID=84647 RepID=UPI000225B1E3|nr:hypothetical protein [Candidatus Odyssella thessalonicensis]
MKIYAFLALVLTGKTGSLAGWAMDVDRPQAVSSYSHVLPQRDGELAFNPFRSLSNSDLRNLRLSCRTFNELVLQHYQVCQPVSGKKQHIPLNKAEKFYSLAKIIRNEFHKIGLNWFNNFGRIWLEDRYKERRDSYFQLGEMYWQGLRNSPKYYKALDCYLQAYRLGSEEAIKNLAGIYEGGLEHNGIIIVSKDSNKANQLLSRFSKSEIYISGQLHRHPLAEDS